MYEWYIQGIQITKKLVKIMKILSTFSNTTYLVTNVPNRVLNRSLRIIYFTAIKI